MDFCPPMLKLTFEITQNLIHNSYILVYLDLAGGKFYHYDSLS